MMKRLHIGIVAGSILLTFSAVAFPCSAFLVSTKEQTLVGRNLDWEYGHGFLIVNKRGLEKKALVSKPNQPARWVAKYGSVTFNQVGRELPYGGLNERGLDVEQLWLRSARYPSPNAKPALNELQWIQYQLDNFSSVREVLAGLEKTDIVKRVAPIHYFVCDASGECATIDPVDGRFEVHSGKSLPVAALTNDTYSDSIRYADGFLSSKDFSSLPAGTKSLARFARLSFSLTYDTGTVRDSIAAAYARLADVSSPISDENDDLTQWAIVMDLKRKVIHFKTLGNPKERTVNLAELDLSCGKPSQVLALDGQGSGDVTAKFEDYSPSMNAGLVSKSLETGFAHLPPEAIQKIAGYPDSAICRN